MTLCRLNFTSLLTLIGLVFAGGVALGVFSDNGAAGANSFSTDTLNPATSLSATLSGTNVDLSWTATSDGYASGHRVYRASTSGGPYTQIAEVTPRTTTTHQDSPGSGTFYYVVRAFAQNWESNDSNEAPITVP